MAEVQLRDVSMTYEGNTIPTIKGLNLDIDDGEFMVLVGPSGSGKSSVLRVIAGLEYVEAGTVSIGKRIVNDVEPKDRNIAMVFQNYALYPHMTAFDNMAFGLKLRKLPRDEIRARVEQTASLLGIQHLLSRKPKALSGGEKQRVALGRAIVRQPTVFLFDEPLSNLDAKLRTVMRTEIKKLHKRLNTTMIFVTHDQVEAMTMGDRIAVMSNGVIHQIDTPLKLYDEPADQFVAGFIGNPSMNFLDAVVTETGLSLREISCSLPEEKLAPLKPYIGMTVTLGLRPEHISFHAEACHIPVGLSMNHDVSELLGNETYHYLSDDSQTVVMRNIELLRLAINERVNIYLDLAKAHFFEQESGKRIA